MSEPTMTFRVGLTRRYNLGDYQHIEGTAEVAGPVPPGQTPEEAIAAAQAMLARRLAKETLLGQANRPAPAAPAPASAERPQASAPAERPQASAPAPAAEPAVSAADLRMRLKAALAANPQLIPVMQAFLHERGARGLQSAPDALLPELAQVMNVKVTP